MVRRLFDRELVAEMDRWVYVGDSTNDQVMFQRFPCSVGVANLRRFAHELEHWPAWITRGERGTGFAELATALLRARSMRAGDGRAHAAGPRDGTGEAG
jgi:hydroxymethylpyrimidine pyrophosphatase-like HAD family hydrolase